MDSETKARRSAGRKLRHRAAQLRKLADELDAVAVELESILTISAGPAAQHGASQEDAA